MNKQNKLERMGYKVTFHSGYVVAQKGNNKYVDKDLSTLTRVVLSYVQLKLS